MQYYIIKIKENSIVSQNIAIDFRIYEGEFCFKLFKFLTPE
jgi:hypothetical protein